MNMKQTTDSYIGKFANILEEMQELTNKKHSDYGDKTYNKYGLKMRFADIWRKFARLESLIWEGNPAKVSDESIRDTLIDLAVYSVMAIIVFDEEHNDSN